MIGNKCRLLVVGGRQRKNALDLMEWHAYESGLILQIDPDALTVEAVVDYRSPPEVCAEESPSITFKAGDLGSDGKRMLVCTQTELIEYCCQTWKPTFYFSHPTFNDLHHVRYKRGSEVDGEHVLVANTGLDQIVEIAIDRRTPANSKIVRQWSTSEVDTWERFDPEVDYRRIATTKPHQSHPNFIFEFNNSIFATRFHQQDALELSSARVIDVPQGNPHDGIVRGSEVSFTTTNGYVVQSSLETGKQTAVFDLNSMQSTNELLGWCRGIAWENREHAWVGFSRIRPTWLRKNLSWIKHGFRQRGEYGTRPTRVAQYDFETGEMVCEIELEEYGLNAVFGVYLLQDRHG